ncbi:uncharacterized protein LOC122888279 isoform X2 [Siniperca chuatsi]|uniref:uncharacterized protein LOC122888279 isoform X2 n=1 Tax=Siniperca chuatsi TaxID=119488 RepID=UPI001CE0B927|nr:uncharacterized protein LOC122888279 isoform X2 [Siniperca chuatsi]
MLVLVWLLFLTMTTMKSDEIITARSGEAVLLTSRAVLQRSQDARWTHHHLAVSLRNNRMRCQHGRCELLSNGSLRFSRLQTADSGNYTLEVFDESGKRLMKKDFELRVEDSISNSNSSNSNSNSSSSAVVSVLICCFLLLLLFIIIFILRRRSQRMRTAGPLQENVYMVMQHGGKRKDEEEKQEREEESIYVPCNPIVSMETPSTQQMSEDLEDIYV